MFSHAALNATLNGTSAVLLTCGYVAIRARKIAVHKAFMIAAFLDVDRVSEFPIWRITIASVTSRFRGRAGFGRSISHCC